MRWRFLVSPADDGPRNMALDEALMGRAARTGEAVFRAYAWSKPTLSLGRNQRARGAYAPGAARASGVEFVRRPTGGRALLHHREVTYSVTMPTASAAEAAAVYEFINTVLLAALARLGVPAQRGGAGGAPSIPPGLRPCFDAPSEHEIVVNGRKLIGSAQWRRAGALLQHGSILIRDDQALIGQLMRATLAVTPAAATLADSMGREPGLEEVAAVLRESLAGAVGGGQMPATLAAEPEVEAEAARLEVRYSDDAWTWRR